MKKFILTLIICLLSNFLLSQELIIGEEKVDPGIILIFEGAVKDIVYPDNFNLSENLSDIHIEARINWDTENIIYNYVPFIKLLCKYRWILRILSPNAWCSFYAYKN